MEGSTAHGREVCFHQDRALGIGAFGYSVLLLTIHTVRLVMRVPILVAPGLIHHVGTAGFALFLIGLAFVVRCKIERWIVLFMLAGNFVVLLLATLPQQSVEQGMLFRSLAVLLWAGATGCSAAVVARKAETVVGHRPE